MTSDIDKEPILQTNSLTFNSDGIDLLRKIDYAIYPDNFHLLFGEKGAGKTLIGKILSGKIKQTSGTIAFNGEPIAHTKKIKNQNIAFISEEHLLHKNLSIKDIIELNLNNTVTLPREAKKIFHDINAIYNFTISLGYLFHDLSYNEKCLFLIILSFIKKPAILIIDSILDNIPKSFLKKIFDIINNHKPDNLSILFLSNSIDNPDLIMDMYLESSPPGALSTFAFLGPENMNIKNQTSIKRGIFAFQPPMMISEDLPKLEDFGRSVLENIAFGISENYHALKALVKTEFVAYCAGGLAKSEEFNQLLANVLNAEISIPFERDSAFIGVAMNSLKALDIYSDFNGSYQNYSTLDVCNILSLLSLVPR